MVFKSFNEAISFAIDKEQEAIDFYEMCSKEETFSGTKQMFLDFSNEERKHIQLIENIDEKISSSLETVSIPDLKRSNYLVDTEYKKGMGYAEILQLAMKREEKAVQLYTDLSQNTTHQSLVQLFKQLAQEESNHKYQLETLYDDFMAKLGD